MRKIVSAIFTLSLVALASGHLHAKTLAEEAKDRFHVEFSVGYETVGSVMLEVTPFVYMKSRDKNTGKEEIAKFPLCISFSIGYDIAGNKIMPRFGYLDRCFFDDSNGIRFMAQLSMDVSLKKNKENESGGMGLSMLLGAGYVRKIADGILVNADVGWKLGLTDDGRSSVFGRVTISFGYRPLIAY